MPLVELARFHDRAQAAVLQSALTDAGIDSFIFDQETVMFVPARLMVLDDDLSDAKRLLERMP